MRWGGREREDVRTDDGVDIALRAGHRKMICATNLAHTHREFQANESKQGFVQIGRRMQARGFYTVRATYDKIPLKKRVFVPASRPISSSALLDTFRLFFSTKIHHKTCLPILGRASKPHVLDLYAPG